MFRQGDIIIKDSSDKCFIVISNDWLNSNSRHIVVLPAKKINSRPEKNRRTHLVVYGKNVYEVYCEKIVSVTDAPHWYSRVDNIDMSNIRRIRNRLLWMFNPYIKEDLYA